MTLPDGRAPIFDGGPARRGGPIPSVKQPAARPAGAPANVIPFTKPRAIAAIAATNPGAVVTMAPPSVNRADRTPARPRRGTPAPLGPTAFMAAPPPTAPPSMPMAAATIAPAPAQWPRGGGAAVAAPSTAVSSGWTPPQAVKAIAQPVTDRAAPSTTSSASTNAAPAAPAPAPAPMFTAPAPAFAAPAPPVLTTRPAAQLPATEPLPEPAPRKWAIYERLGLGAPKIDSQKAAKLIVNAYRLLGFAILTIIVVVLVGYITSSVFYYFSNSWIVPMAVSPTDEKVVALQSQLAGQQTARDRLADELGQSERAILVQQRFQSEFAKAIRSDLEGRKLALSRIQALATAASQTRAAIKSQNSAYANASSRRMAQEYAAGLIDRTAMLSGKFQIAQITNSNLTLAERQAEFETRAAELEAQTRSLDAILTNAGNASPALSYEVLRIKQEYEASRLDLAKAIEARDTIKAALARQDKIVASLKQSAYLRAVADQGSVAFVPYANLSNVSQGTSIYACKLGMLFCYHAGEVLEVLPGEVQFKHPHRDKNLRGQLVVLKLDEDDRDAAADDVLFVGGRPVLF